MQYARVHTVAAGSARCLRSRRTVDWAISAQGVVPEPVPSFGEARLRRNWCSCSAIGRSSEIRFRTLTPDKCREPRVAVKNPQPNFLRCSSVLLLAADCQGAAQGLQPLQPLGKRMWECGGSTATVSARTPMRLLQRSAGSSDGSHSVGRPRQSTLVATLTAHQKHLTLPDHTSGAIRWRSSASIGPGGPAGRVPPRSSRIEPMLGLGPGGSL